MTTIQRRVDAFGAGRVRQTEEDGIRVQLLGGNNLEEAKSLIGQTVRLDFKERTCTEPACMGFTDADLERTGEDLANAFAEVSPYTGEWVANLQLDSRGTQIFSELTQRMAVESTKRIAILLDGEEIIAPVARAWISNGRSVITGNFSREEARTLSIPLESGPLPFPVALVEERPVEPIIGTRQLVLGLAGVITAAGLVAIVVVKMTRRKPVPGTRW